MTHRINVDPTIHFGKPCVRGTRIPVNDVLQVVREGIDFSTIIADYFPDISRADIQACVQYAMDVVASEDINLAATP